MTVETTAQATIGALKSKLADYEAERAAILGDVRLAEPAKQKDVSALDGAVNGEIETQKKELFNELGAGLAALESEKEELIRAARITPANPEEWALANSKASFVREDAERLATTAPDELVRQYQKASVEKDHVTMFLLSRYAGPALEKVAREGTGETVRGAAGRSLRGLSAQIAEQEAPDAASLSKLDARRAKLDALRAELMRIHSPRVQESIAAEYARRW